MCLKARDSLWYLDSGYSRHMTGDESKLSDFVSKDGGYVKFGDNNKGNVENQDKIQIKNVLYMDGLKHNLRSISQLCDKDFKIKFNKNM